MLDRIVVVTRPTQLEDLIARFNTEAQARFYLEQLGASFEAVQAAHERYQAAQTLLRAQLPPRVKQHVIARAYLPNYLFGERDLVVTIGPDGLAANTAKYLPVQPLLAVNPDPLSVDGVLARCPVEAAGAWVMRAVAGQAPVQAVSLAEATLHDGQSLLAFNEIFVGARTHVSARYRLTLHGQTEAQSSSGVIVATGAGSTGWLKSIVTGAAGVTGGLAGGAWTPPAPESYQLPWESPRLTYAVREPFVSRMSAAGLVYGPIEPGESLMIRSEMPEGGVIFSDGIEADALDFNAGAIATIHLATRQAHLVQTQGGM